MNSNKASHHVRHSRAACSAQYSLIYTYIYMQHKKQAVTFAAIVSSAAHGNEKRQTAAARPIFILQHDNMHAPPACRNMPLRAFE